MKNWQTGNTFCNFLTKAARMGNTVYNRYLSWLLKQKLLRAHLEEMFSQSHQRGVLAAALLTC